MKNYSIGQARDTGLAIVLILLILSSVFRDNGETLKRLLWPAIGLLLICMAAPVVFKPLAPLWFGFSHILGRIVSTVFFSVIYISLALPMGLLRKSMGKDPMRLKIWKKGQDSVFVTRNHLYSSVDLKNPF